MDWVTLSGRGITLIKKYRYMLLLVTTGIILLNIPAAEKADVQEKAEPSTPQSIEESLSHILSMIEGAGSVEVMLTQMMGEEILYQTDDSKTSGEYSQDIRKNTVLIEDSNRVEGGLIRQRNPPVYQGAIILCQGADKASIRLAIVEAVVDVTGLSSDRITVLKMK